MLSRVADALFWMSRYLERAEHIARLLDIGFHLELDLRGVLAGPRELHWTSLAAILQQQVPVTNGPASSPQAAISRWLTFDGTNPNSIISCVARARNNARSSPNARASWVGASARVAWRSGTCRMPPASSCPTHSPGADMPITS